MLKQRKYCPGISQQEQSTQVDQHCRQLPKVPYKSTILLLSTNFSSWPAGSEENSHALRDLPILSKNCGAAMRLGAGHISHCCPKLSTTLYKSMVMISYNKFTFPHHLVNTWVVLLCHLQTRSFPERGTESIYRDIHQ